VFLMPALPFTQALTPNQLGFNPLSGWQYEYVPAEWGSAVVSLLMRSDGAANNVRATVYSGSQTIQERAPMQVGGTAGVTPSPLNTAPTTWIARGGDRLKLSIDETAGVTPTVDGLVVIEPA
jgi:hypothetical protein